MSFRQLKMTAFISLMDALCKSEVRLATNKACSQVNEYSGFADDGEPSKPEHT